MRNAKLDHALQRKPRHSCRDLHEAYRASEYQVFGKPQLTLAVDRHEPALAALLVAAGVDSAAYLTACNPGSRRLSEPENAARTQALRSHLAEHGYRIREGTAIDPGGLWPAEPSFLVLGIDAGTARAIASHFGQNALLLIGADAIARLYWLT